MNKKDYIFKEIFDKSPIGIFCYDKKGKIINANPTALKIAGIDAIDNFKKVNLFDNPDIASKKSELLEKGLIKFQSQLNYDDIKNKGFYVPTRSGTAFIDWTVSVTGSNFLVQIQDITEHEKAEKEFKKEQELLNAIIDTIPVMISIYDPEIEVLKINKETEKITGWTQEDMNHIDLMTELYPDPDYRREVEEYMQSLTPGWKELIMNTKDGSKVDSLWANVNISDGRNVGIGLDIRDRKKSEEDLKRHAALLDISYEAIFSWSFEEGILSWNRGAERLYGYNKEESVGKISHNLLKTKFPVEFGEFIKKLADEKMWTGELIHTTKEGNEIIVESRQQLIQDASGKKVVIETNRDITGRKKSENKNKYLINELQKFTEELETSNEELHAAAKELHTANEELKQSQKLMQDTINGYPSIIFVKDLEGRFININNKLEDLLGVSNEELIGKTDYDLFPTEEAEYYRAHDRKVLEEGRVITIEEETDLTDGHHIFLANKFPIYDIDGNPYGVGSISTDITEIKKYEMQINRQNKLLNGINKVFQQSLICETVEEVVEKCLEVAEELTGSDFSFIGEVNENRRLDDRAVSPPGWDACTADPKKARKLLSNMEIVSYWGRTVKEGKSQIVNDPDSDPDKRGIPEGHPPIKSFLGVPLKQGNKTIGLIALANKEGGYTEEDKDNIETLSVAFVEALKRKQAEVELKDTLEHLEEQVEECALKLEDAYETLKEKEIKYRSLYENAPVGIFHSTLDGKYIDVNPELAKLLGYDSPEDLVSTANKSSIADVIYVNKDLRPGFLESALKADTWFKTENLYRRKDGEVIIGDLSFRGFGKDKDENPLLEGFMTDITDRKRSEEKLKEIISELERSNKELQSFAYITSHDLQEPLRTIASYAQLIERRYKGKLDSDADEFIEFMVDGSRRMKQMIQGLLDYSRVGTLGHEFTEFDAEDALNYALSNLGSAISEVDAEITDDELPVIFADKDQIVRIFQNLIGNAIKFSSDGVQPKIHISSHKKDNEYVFSVSDNGIGLEKQYSDQIFEVFKRLHSIGEYKGAGIGLAIVKRIIDRHGGRVWVESEPCVGSTFYFTIPTEKN
ncbi:MULTISPECIES: PAS domain S-box protein [Methanobacterium]|uniref:histidine kinase n=1 Tax=Methanobacterium veterum TaxID=408577 RepID=A0A9E5DLL9_9EURY|nr:MULTISPECIES: PAS domain S-box protein [Methanobacterium]MCZ3365755.1 PAS domain S-box protein [Methanobacterium veterum]MCZ3371219.1 PAS domain S-box protein [Methanobacterium veterum]